MLFQELFETTEANFRYWKAIAREYMKNICSGGTDSYKMVLSNCLQIIPVMKLAG